MPRGSHRDREDHQPAVSPVVALAKRLERLGGGITGRIIINAHGSLSPLVASAIGESDLVIPEWSGTTQTDTSGIDRSRLPAWMKDASDAEILLNLIARGTTPDNVSGTNTLYAQGFIQAIRQEGSQGRYILIVDPFGTKARAQERRELEQRELSIAVNILDHRPEQTMINASVRAYESYIIDFSSRQNGREDEMLAALQKRLPGIVLFLQQTGKINPKILFIIGRGHERFVSLLRNLPALQRVSFGEPEYDMQAVDNQDIHTRIANQTGELAGMS